MDADKFALMLTPPLDNIDSDRVPSLDDYCVVASDARRRGEDAVTMKWDFLFRDWEVLEGSHIATSVGSDWIQVNVANFNETAKARSVIFAEIEKENEWVEIKNECVGACRTPHERNETREFLDQLKQAAQQHECVPEFGTAEHELACLVIQLGACRADEGSDDDPDDDGGASAVGRNFRIEIDDYDGLSASETDDKSSSKKVKFHDGSGGIDFSSNVKVIVGPRIISAILMNAATLRGEAIFEDAVVVDEEVVELPLAEPGYPTRNHSRKKRQVVVLGSGVEEGRTTMLTWFLEQHGYHVLSSKMEHTTAALMENVCIPSGGVVIVIGDALGSRRTRRSGPSPIQRMLEECFTDGPQIPVIYYSWSLNDGAGATARGRRGGGGPSGPLITSPEGLLRALQEAFVAMEQDEPSDELAVDLLWQHADDRRMVNMQL